MPRSRAGSLRATTEGDGTTRVGASAARARGATVARLATAVAALAGAATLTVVALRAGAPSLPEPIEVADGAVPVGPVGAIRVVEPDATTRLAPASTPTDDPAADGDATVPPGTSGGAPIEPGAPTTAGAGTATGATASPGTGSSSGAGGSGTSGSTGGGSPSPTTTAPPASPLPTTGIPLVDGTGQLVGELVDGLPLVGTTTTTTPGTPPPTLLPPLLPGLPAIPDPLGLGSPGR